MGIRIFVTGAGGYLGSVLAKRLAELPEVDSITGTVNRTTPPTPLPDKVKLVKMDVRSPELTDVMAGHDFVIHTAFIVQWLKKMPAAVRDDINLNGTRNVAQAAVKNRVAGFLHASSLAAYDPAQVHRSKDIDENYPIGNGNSSMYYWNSKAVTEKILSETLAASGTILTLFRIGYIIGPMNRATVPGFRVNAVLFPGINPLTQFSHEDDVARAFALALSKQLPGAFNIAPDDCIRLSEVYRIIGAKPMTVPVWLARLITFIRWNFLQSPTHPSWVQATLVEFTASNAKLKAAGWVPQYRNSADAIRTALS